MLRKSMRPLSLKRIIEVCNLLHNKNTITFTEYADIKDVTHKRSREILRAMHSMNFIDKKDDYYVNNSVCDEFMIYLSDNNWNDIHVLFYNNNIFYKELINFLQNNLQMEHTVKSIVDCLENHELYFNNASVEILLRWAERFGAIQRHLYKKIFYIVSVNKPKMEQFSQNLENTYKTLNKKKGLFLSQTFVEIPILREEVCKLLTILRSTFDKMFLQYYKENMGRVELAGAPTITSAKNSPINIRKTEININNNIISLDYGIELERKGITFFKKNYYFIGIFYS